MKTKEELNELREEVESLNRKLAELNEDELKQVTGGVDGWEEPKYILGKGGADCSGLIYAPEEQEGK